MNKKRTIFLGILFIGFVFSGTKLYLEWDTNRHERIQAQKNLPGYFQSLIQNIEDEIGFVDQVLGTSNEKEKDHALLNLTNRSAGALAMSLEINETSLIAYGVAPYAINQVVKDLNNELYLAVSDFIETGNRTKLQSFQLHLRMAEGALFKYKLDNKKSVSQLSGADIINYGYYLIDLEILTRKNTYLNRITISRQDQIEVLTGMITKVRWKTGSLDIRTPDFKMSIATVAQNNGVAYEGWIDDSGMITVRDINNSNQYGVIDGINAKDALNIFEKYGWEK